MEKKLEAKLKTVLTDAQQTRLHEIAIQVAGNNAIGDPGVQRSLELSAEQKAKVKALNDKQREAGRAIFEKVRNGDLDPSQAPELMRKNSEILKAELGKVLTDAQRAKLGKLGGAPFKATEEVRN